MKKAAVPVLKAFGRLTVIVLLALVLAASCSSGPSGECTLDDNATCGSGQECILGADGTTVCACSVATGDGCTKGVCVEEGGTPTCVTCSTKNNRGCTNGEVCVSGGNGPTCATCSTQNNGGCANGEVCISGPNGPTCAACSPQDNSGCDSGETCVHGVNGPVCSVCSPTDNSGCPATEFCVADANGVLGCGICSPTDSTGCTNGEVCLLGASGQVGCFCSTADSASCPNGEVCLVNAGDDPGCYCNKDSEAGCTNGDVCEDVPGAYPGCFAPLTIGGIVFDLVTKAPIAGARVVARDVNFAAVSGVSTTDATGHYTLTVPAPRDAAGLPVSSQISLRADAATYVTYPTAPRNALPIDLSTATGTPPHLESSATDIGMIPLQVTTGLGTVSGTVVTAVPVGTLVVAGGDPTTGGGVTGIADTDGTYKVFNVPAGTVTVAGYKAGLNLTPASANVVANTETTGVDLVEASAATATVSGQVTIVNPGNGQFTSVILAVAETFDPNAARAEAPPGLRAGDVSGTFTIPNVPAGNYVVLAAFENDFLVRDPDTSIGGTAIVRITVGTTDFAIPDQFKITGSLDNPSPDAEEVVSGTPTFLWDDDSGEDHYEIRVFDAYGNKVWEKLDVPGFSGAGQVSVVFNSDGTATQALQSGVLYQFRATSIKLGGTPLSATEDLRGVFLYQ